MSDIVDMLRAFKSLGRTSTHATKNALALEAADEIERLRREKEIMSNAVMINLAKIMGILAACNIDTKPLDDILTTFTDDERK